jgi:ATP-dependent DNA helicase RecG
MTTIAQKYTLLLKEQISSIKKENRYLEFKSNYQDAQKLGKYISALSNGACLDRQDFAYLYFGINDKTLDTEGTTFDPLRTKAIGNQDLELYLRQYISPKINFSIDTFLYENKTRMVVFKIPAAVNEPTCFMGKSYIRVDSHITELSPYVEWTRTIYNSKIDWTAEIIEEATINDLDPDAIDLARKGFKQRYPDLAKDVDMWSDTTFLDKAKLTQDGKITRAALLLVGREEKAYLLNHISQLVWKCFQEGEIFGDIYTIPYIKTTSKLLNRIRNYRFKIYPSNSLIPAEVWKYDTESILEGLHNCIAHQDYVLGERIVVTEDKDKLTFENAGGFYEGNYEQYILGEKTPKSYRNPFLVKAMVNIKMIDTQGYGIHKLFMKQKERYLPMPDYEGTTDSRVIMHLPGNVIDENYSLLLLSNHEVTLTDTILLDTIQKGKSISDEAMTMLRKKKLIEGRKPHVYVAKSLAQTTGTKVEYTKHKGLENKKCEALLLNSLKDHGSLTKQEIVHLLWDVLSDQLSDSQKENKVDNLLRKLKNAGKINNKTRGNISTWSLVKS